MKQLTKEEAKNNYDLSNIYRNGLALELKNNELWQFALGLKSKYDKVETNILTKIFNDIVNQINLNTANNFELKTITTESDIIKLYKFTSGLFPYASFTITNSILQFTSFSVHQAKLEADKLFTDEGAPVKNSEILQCLVQFWVSQAEKYVSPDDLKKIKQEIYQSINNKLAKPYLAECFSNPLALETEGSDLIKVTSLINSSYRSEIAQLQRDDNKLYFGTYVVSEEVFLMDLIESENKAWMPWRVKIADKIAHAPFSSDSAFDKRQVENIGDKYTFGEIETSYDFVILACANIDLGVGTVGNLTLHNHEESINQTPQFIRQMGTKSACYYFNRGSLFNSPLDIKSQQTDPTIVSESPEAQQLGFIICVHKNYSKKDFNDLGIYMKSIIELNPAEDNFNEQLPKFLNKFLWNFAHGSFFGRGQASITKTHMKALAESKGLSLDFDFGLPEDQAALSEFHQNNFVTNEYHKLILTPIEQDNTAILGNLTQEGFNSGE